MNENDKKFDSEKIKKAIDKEVGLDEFILALEDCDERELSNLFDSVRLINKEVKMPKEAFLECISKIDDPDTERRLLEMYSGQNYGIISPFKANLIASKLFKFAIPVFLVAIVGIVFLSNPFKKEIDQVAELRNISKDESNFSKGGSDINSFIQDEAKLSALDNSLSNLSGISGNAIKNDGFNLLEINNESNLLNGNLGVDDFINEEKQLKEIDIILAGF